MFRLVVLFFTFLPLLTTSSPILKRTTHTDEYAPRERVKSGVETVVVDATGASQPAVGTTFSIHDLHLGYPSDALVTVNRQSDLDDAPIRTKNTTKEQGDDVPSDDSDKKEEQFNDQTAKEEQNKTEETKDDANDAGESETKPKDTSETSPEKPAIEEPAESSEDQVAPSPADESTSGRELSHELPPIDYAIDIEADRLAQLEEEAESARLEEERQARAERARVLYEMELQAQEKLDAEMAKLKEQQEKERVEREKLQAEQREQREREYQIQKQQQQEQQRMYEEQRRKEQEEQQRQQQQQQQQQQQSPEYAITVYPETTHEVVTANPTETVFNAFQTSTLFQELTVWNAWNLIQVGRPFAIFVLCRCERDDDWNVPRMEALIREKGLSDHFTYLYALPEIQHRFHMFQTYAIDSPALVIDNMPIGQHIEKYVFPKRMARPTQAVPEDMVTFFEDFFKDPTPLPLLIRSRPAPPARAMNERGMVWELVGDTMTDIVFNSPYTVLLLLYSPGCPACHTIMPVFDRVAALLSFSEPNVIIAKLDRTVNDVPFILRFHKYPTILLFRANHKHMNIHHHTSQQHLSARERVQQRGLHGSHGWAAPLDFDIDYRAKQAPQQDQQQQQQQHSCGRPYDEHELIAFVKQHVSKPAIEASSSFESTSSSSSPSA